MEEGREQVGFFEKLATIIVDKKNIVLLVYLFICIGCIFTIPLTKTESNIEAYLSDKTETAQGLNVMNEQFASFASARIMISNITYDDAKMLYDQIVDVDGVSMVNFNNTSNYYKNAKALMSISFAYERFDLRTEKALADIKTILKDYDVTYDTKVGYYPTKDVASQMAVILMINAVLIIGVLILTSNAYIEVPILILTFVVSALLSMGTQFLVGKISFITNAIAVVLQLALSVDYAIIMIHRYTEEAERYDSREACIKALTKAIPEISSSSLTTICGLATLAFMEFGMGIDLAVVLIKAVLFSLLTVFTLMPGILILATPLFEKTKHKKLLPDMSFIGHWCDAKKKKVVPVFIGVLLLAVILSSFCKYSYSEDDMKVLNMSPRHKAYHKINDEFGTSNLVAILVPSGNYDAEKKILNELTACEEVNSCMGLANVSLTEGYVVTDALNPREFSEVFGLDYDIAELLYNAYLVKDQKYGGLLNVDTMEVPMFDMFCFMQDTMDTSGIVLDGEMEEINELLDLLNMARTQLQTDEYSRMVVYLNLPIESEETFEFLDKIHEIADPYYNEGVYVVGTSTNSRDFAEAFKTDNILISVLSVVFVVAVLIFTFRSVGLPILLIVIIQGSIWINFSFQALSGKPLIFLGALIVSALQMGANIDYAIVMSSHFREARRDMESKDAIVHAINKAFPTVMTSGLIMSFSGFIIGIVSNHPIIASMGTALGRGTVVSMILVLFVLPCILVMGEKVTERTTFKLKKIEITEREETGMMRVKGHVRGYVEGVIDAEIDGVVRGTVKARVSTKGELELLEDNADFLTEEKGGAGDEE